MHYVSTRDSSRRLTASQAIVEGLSRDGGLFLPEGSLWFWLVFIAAYLRARASVLSGAGGEDHEALS